MSGSERRGDLDIAYDAASGQIRSLRDRALDMEVIAFAPGAERRVVLPADSAWEAT